MALRGLHVEEANVLGIAGDRAATRLDVLTHQDGEQLVGRGIDCRGREPPRPAGTADGRYRRDRGGCASLATAIEEGRDVSSMSGVLAEGSYRVLPA
ncbi:hypothetical protein [Nocardia sp. NPDC057440]|uniref:hypothetical protein n=1 Tax=Nocardia sp. NPDC057440 TaxID=3346134 RepID=UPI00366E14BC